jgi:cell division ATPase FtsA
MIRITRGELRDIMKARIEEIFENAKNQLEKRGLNLSLINNIVLTGGGASTTGIDKIANRIFAKNIRLAAFNKIDNLPNELYEYSNSCSAGMLLFLKDMYLRERITDGFEVKNGLFKNIIEKLVSV